MNKKTLIPTLGILTLATAGLLSTTTIRADNEAALSPFVQKLADKFGLNADEVESAMDEVRQERQMQWQEAAENRLNQAVEDGVITKEQKEALIQKQQQMREERENQLNEMQTWMEEQGIDRQILMEYGGMGMGHGSPGRHHMGMF